jgi:hypothetical protein
MRAGERQIEEESSLRAQPTSWAPFTRKRMADFDTIARRLVGAAKHHAALTRSAARGALTAHALLAGGTEQQRQLFERLPHAIDQRLALADVLI